MKAHPRRLEVTKDLFLENPQIGVVYSTFEIIDEKNNLTPIERITTSILEILESHTHPLEGKDVWIKMGTETGYTNLTSSTAVRVKFVYQCPFPNEEVSEDFHSWLRMSTFDANFKYTPLIPSKYRIPTSLKYPASRIRLGLGNFNKIKARVDIDGQLKSHC